MDETLITAKNMLREGRKEEARTLLEEMVKKNPLDFSAVMTLARFYHKEKICLDEAEKLLKHLLLAADHKKYHLSTSRKVDVLIYLAKIQITKEKQKNQAIDYTEVKSYLELSLQLHEDTRALYLLTRIARAEGNISLQEEYLKRILRIYEAHSTIRRDPFVYYENGLLKKEQGKLDQAIESFETVLSMKDDHFSEFELAKLYIKRGRLEQSRELLLDLVKKRPNDFYVLYEIGSLERTLGQTANAFYYLDKARNLCPEDAALHLEYAKLYRKMSDLKTAREEAVKAHALFQKDSKYFIGRDLAKLEIGRIDACEGNLEAVAKNFDLLRNSTIADGVMIEEGRMALHLGYLEIAEKQLSYVADQFDDPNARYLWGVTQKDMGNLDRADREFCSLLATVVGTQALKERIYIQIKREDYENAYQMLQELEKIRGIDHQLETVELKFFLKNQLNILSDEEKESSSYFARQLHNYQKEVAITHIQMASSKGTAWEPEMLRTEYLDPFLSEIKAHVKTLSPDSFTYIDKYIMKCDQPVATIYGRLTDRVTAITISKRNDIIRLYPSFPETIGHFDQDQNRQLVKTRGEVESRYDKKLPEL